MPLKNNLMNNAPRNFGLIGIAGYIAERHLKAIKDTGNRLLASLDKFDCVGKIDNYFPESDFFVEYERFDRHIDKLKRTGVQLDYVSICSPNYLHDSHIRFALRHQADAICEKPVVLNPWNIDALQEIEKETGRHIFNILQLRYHPVILNLRERIMALPKNRKHDIDLTYITSRGNWYHISWKGDINKSGGIATNIGVHFFDMLGWIFGPVVSNRVHLLERDKASGYLELENARVRWFLSIDWNDLPDEVKENGKRTYRHITVNNEELEFSEGFTDL
ncbi:MAG TPA: Gfo/Idh/MocA family oxidoreductase, partial [Bacteroidales bacterium]|nr:Gfo/Idh/MocA family oxidoreductase [Bacteroidales bacterium]